mmetsp:Transcript_29105/g.78794  ORF Transcript_29105/g.78794 Transcript_29105/m.78794 type:complete len:656 (+) Transcript_29105:182-2149(+)
MKTAPLGRASSVSGIRGVVAVIAVVTLAGRLRSVRSFSPAATAAAAIGRMQDTIAGSSRLTSTTLWNGSNNGKAGNQQSNKIKNKNWNGNHNNNNKTKNGARPNGRNKSSVAIIGGGIAGLSCARHLQTAYDVTVYDTGRLRPGGRASSRQPNDKPKEDGDTRADNPFLSRFRYDHAAQFITSPEPTGNTESVSWRSDFDRQVQEWIDQDVLRVAPPNSVYSFEPKTTKCLNPAESSDTQQLKQRFCYPQRGMSSLVNALVSGGTFDIEQDVWVSPSSGVKYFGPPPPQGSNARNGVSKNSWSVRAQGQTLGKHDHLIVAHNGKCADRLMSKTPARDVHSLLRTNFNDRVPANGGQKMTLNSIYSLTICLSGPSLLAQNLPEAFVGGFVQDHPRLGLVTCQTNKYPTETYQDESGDVDEDRNTEVWTILSTASFAKKNKAPQEFLPDDVVQNVTQMLLDSIETDIIGRTAGKEVPKGSLHNQALDSRLQLWGAGVPLNVWRGESAGSSSASGSAGFIHDPRYQVGVCGDWLLEASIAGAWTSGRRLAQHLIDTDHSSSAGGVGFEKGRFEASQSVTKLGLGSLDGPMNKNNGANHNRGTNHRGGRGGGRNNNASNGGRGGRGRGGRNNSANNRGRRSNDRTKQNQTRNEKASASS